MDAEQYSRVKLLFGEVCDLPESERGSRLRQLTSDAEVVEYVERLLRQTNTDHPRVSQPVLHMLSAVAGDEVKVGDTLGAWRLVGEIGQGGMGTVFRAQRSDGHFEQEAAVKLLHGIPSAKSLAYLARERQILATLTHPNIARLYDGGTTPHGQPYLVMEVVDGIAIDRHVRDNSLTVQGILKLMIDVCGAISFAHQRLIVHCDIKPSNILVTSTGRPVLLDFGIARLLDHETRNEPVPHEAVTGASSKQTIARAFTPQYASPEQRGGQALTTATDVYSLGRLLGELLPSGAHLNGELRAVVAKAAADEPAERYITTAALAADMKRYLQREPVRALPATLFLSHQGEHSFEAYQDPAAALAFFQRDFADALALIPDFADQYRLHPVGVLGTLRCPHWSRGDRALLIGDAAHAIVPFHGQGMNCAFEDCVALIDLIERHRDDRSAPDWTGIFANFELQRRPNAHAIAEMALENYLEMRDAVADPGYQLRRQLELELARRLPGRFIPRYSMVMFTSIPYAQARERGVLQRALLEELTAGKRALDQIDLDAAERSALARIPAISA